MQELKLTFTPREARHLHRFLEECDGNRNAFRYYPQGDREKWLDKLLAAVEPYMEGKDGPETKAQREGLF